MSMRAWLKRLPGLRFIVYRIDPHHRAIARINRQRPGALLQPADTTRAERYPQIFDYVARHLARTTPRLLSYGCSRGDEVFALRRRFAAATIIGADINPRSLAHAARRLRRAPDPALTFRQCHSPAQLAPDGPFDAVLCMAVLRHGDLQATMPPSCAGILPFARAEAVATELAALVAPGGYLALWHVHFRFDDMAVAREFEVVLRLEPRRGANQPLYGPDDQRLSGVIHDAAVYRRRQA